MKIIYEANIKLKVSETVDNTLIEEEMKSMIDTYFKNVISKDFVDSTIVYQLEVNSNLEFKEN